MAAILLEHPLDELTGNFLRVETLFSRVDVLINRFFPIDHHFCLLTLLEIAELEDQFDLNAQILGQLDDQKKKPDETQAVEDALSGGVGTSTSTSETDADKKAKSTADKHAKDVYLKETQQIVADWLQALSPKVAKLNAPSKLGE